MKRILSGVRIIDFTQGHTGSYGTMLLADFGAEVIKVEDHNIGGDVLRKSFPKTENGSAYHAYMNRGKKSICIDRKNERGQRLIRKLIKNADVVCESFPAGELEQCGLGYEMAFKINPGIIYASHTGFGKTGPMSNTAGNDITAEALCGLMEITGFEEREPTAHGSRMADQFGGVFLAFSIVSALMARDITGEGQQIDIASADCMFSALEDILIAEMMTGRRFRREGNRSRAIAPYDTFQVKDGIVSTAVSTNSQWEKFCIAMDMSELLDDPRYSSNESRGEYYLRGLRDVIAEKFKKMTKNEVENLLRPLNVPSGPGYTVEEAFRNQQLKVRNMIVEVEDRQLGRIKMPGIPIKMQGINDQPVGSAPILGEDTEKLLTDAGVSKENIMNLEECGVIMCKGGRSI
ncbi:CaiB/BaiF CoA transferase family protein [Lentihominibacter sp.]|uniref:CaiB/BaiF CoA transferase family protein n=1 Tax=Lentihominibacter sp. TaxID=2944216 RepID=UPI00399150C9